MNKQEAIDWYNNITGGHGLIREDYKKQFKIGALADDLWYDNRFAYGMEYGVLLALTETFNLTEKDLEGERTSES